jgi:hypothetical protein
MYCMRHCSLSILSTIGFAAALIVAAPALADCTDPAYPVGTIVYNSDFKAPQYCDGDYWWSMKGGTAGLLKNLVDVDDALAPADGEVLTYDSSYDASNTPYH